MRPAEANLCRSSGVPYELCSLKLWSSASGPPGLSITLPILTTLSDVLIDFLGFREHRQLLLNLFTPRADHEEGRFWHNCSIITWREWIPVGKRLRSSMTVLLLLTVLCQSALPCGCAKCGIGMERSSVACGWEACGGDQCQAHHHQCDTGCCDSASQAACCHCPHEPQDSCPDSHESTCRRLIVIVSGSGSELRLATTGAIAFDRQPVFFTDASLNLQHFLTYAERDFCTFESSLLARCVRLQV